MAKKVFAMYLAKEGNPNSDAYAKLDLPASPWELWDALDKVQSSWEFYRNVREFIHYVHIKDAIFKGRSENGGFNKAEFTFPGEGEGDVVRIVTDLLKNGYDGGFSMEPHMKLVFHEENAAQNAVERMDNYIEYGKRFMKLVEDARASLAR